MPGPPPLPPVPERRPHRLEAHGDVRVDEWYWLGDRSNPGVLPHLKAENDYADAVLSPLGRLRDALYQEIRARIVETDLSVPVRRGPWWYYQRTIEGKDYPVHCRRPAAPDDDPPVEEASVTPPDEEMLLDENALAEGHEFLHVANLVVSPDHRWLAYGTDTTGGELFDLRFRRLAGGTDGDRPDPADEVIPATYYGWPGHRTAAPSSTPGWTTPCGPSGSGATGWAPIRRRTHSSSKNRTNASP